MEVSLTPFLADPVPRDPVSGCGRCPEALA